MSTIDNLKIYYGPDETEVLAELVIGQSARHSFGQEVFLKGMLNCLLLLKEGYTTNQLEIAVKNKLKDM